MNKTTAKRLAEKYGMEIVRNPITNEAQKLIVESIDLIPELDSLTEEDTRGGEWAECAAATDAYTDREIALHVERV